MDVVLSRPGRARSARLLRPKIDRLAILMLAGPLLFLGAFFLLPLAWIVSLSVWPAGFDVSSYSRVWSSPVYVSSLVWTSQLALITAFATLLLGYPVAYAMANSGPRLRFFLLICIILPFWTSALVRTFSWVAILGRQGMVNSALQGMGIAEQPFQLVFNPLGAVIGTTHVMIPFMILSLYATMQGIDRSLMSAAESLGASRLRAFLLVYVPQTAPGLMSGFLLVFIISLGFFVTPAVLGGTHTPTLAVLIEQNMNKLLDWAMAAALATILLGLTLLFYGVFHRQVAGALGGTRTQSGGGSSLFAMLALVDRAFRFARVLFRKAGAGSHPGRPALLRRRPEAGVVIGVLIAAVTALPIVLIVLIAFFPSHSMNVDFSNFSLRWFEMYFSRAEWLNATWTSFKIAFGCASLTGVLALASALGLRRLPSRGRTLLIPFCIAPLVIPALVYGLSAYFLFAHLGIVGTELALALAHTVLALPAAFLLMLAGVQSLDERLEDAAASLGASPWRQFRFVVLPLLAPTLVVSALVAFLISFDELNVALFLASGAAKTLPKLMYDSIVYENDPRVTAASAVLVGITVVSLGAIYGIRYRSAAGLRR